MSRFHSKILALLFVFLLLLMVSACGSSEVTGTGVTYTDDSGTTDDSVVCPSSYCLPDTGQTESYTDTFGEDSDYLIHPPAYQDNEDGTVNDLNTGLMWQQDTTSLNMNWTFSPNASSYCSNLSLAGYSDWRLPTADELLSIVDYGTSNPAIDVTAFPETHITGVDTSYWSSTTEVRSAETFWRVDFQHGFSETEDDDNVNYVRCVRGSLQAASFIDNEDGTITDQKTQLVWQQSTGNFLSWESAIDYCENLTLGSQTDWRLPNIKELVSIVNFSNYNTALPRPFEAPQNTFSLLYWSSTAQATNSSRAWRVDFDRGRVLRDGVMGHVSSVRCVRGG